MYEYPYIISKITEDRMKFRCLGIKRNAETIQASISIEKSCEFVADKLRDSKVENNTYFELQTDVDGETIFKWYKNMKTSKYLNYAKRIGPTKMSPENVEMFLQQFPIETRTKIATAAKRSPTEPF